MVKKITPNQAAEVMGCSPSVYPDWNAEKLIGYR